MPAASNELLFDRQWSEPSGNFTMTVDQSHFGVTRMFGKGTMAGTRAFVEMLDESVTVVGEDVYVRALVDLRELTGSPLRSQILLGKWLLKNKHRFHRIAVFGGDPWEMKLARAIATLARFKNIGFYGDETPALSYLDNKG